MTIIFTTVTYGSEDIVQLLEAADKIRTSNPAKMSALLDTIEPSKLTGNTKEYYQYLVAFNHYTFGEPLKTKQLLRQLVEGKPLNDIRLRAYVTLLTVYMSTDDWSNGIQTAQLMQEGISQDLNLSLSAKEDAELFIMIFYNHLGEFDLARTLATNLLIDVQSPRVKCMAQSELLYSQIKIAPQDVKFERFEQASKDCALLGDLILENVLNGFLAKYFLAINKPNEALNVLESNISDVKSTQYQALIAGFYELMAEGYIAVEDYAKAERYAKIIIETKDRHQYTQTITTAFETLAKVAEHWKFYDQALYYYKKYEKAHQLDLDQDHAKLLALQKATFDAVEKSNQIALLDSENALLRTQALLAKEAAQNKRLALALLCIVIIVIGLWAYKNRRTYIKMRHFAETDELTGIANRHHFAQQVNSAVEYCQKTDQPVSFVLFDLDHFKKINDTYGHQVGDTALKMAVTAAQTACRKNDIIGRLGGEEFGILLPGCASHLAAHIADSCRREIAKSTNNTQYEFTLTASFGVSDSTLCGYDFDKLFAGADTALYQSKGSGRNRVASYSAGNLNFES